MARRGRKRNPNAKHRETTRAKRQPPDYGTPELRAHRANSTGSGDPTLGTTPLGQYFAAGIITEPQHRAGTLYAQSFWAVYGRPFPKSGAYEQTIPSTLDSDSFPDQHARDHDREEFNLADKSLLNAGRHVRQLTQNLVVYQNKPKGMALIPQIRLGLNALAGAYQCE